MMQEQIQQSVEQFNSLSPEKKQAIWNSLVDKLSKIDINELTQNETQENNGGNVGYILAGLAPTFIEIFKPLPYL